MTAGQIKSTKAHGWSTDLVQASVDTRVPPWQLALGQSIRDPLELLAALDISPRKMNLGADIEYEEVNGEGSKFPHDSRHFPLRVPWEFVGKMEKGNIEDPLLLQVLPQARENCQVPGYTQDPLREQAEQVGPGVIYKYRGRILLVTTGACAVHCRYCFRRHFPYGESNPSRGDWRWAIEAVASQPEAEEVILSGGDPLSLPDDRLAHLVRELEAIPHVKRIRIHTRMPTILPQRICASLLEWLNNLKEYPKKQDALQVVMVVHVNHAQEIGRTRQHIQGFSENMAKLSAAGVTLLNQAVLLKGVNDSVAIQAALAEALFAAGILPYYLHQLDPVQGAAHFDVSDQDAKEIMTGLRARLPGYLVPRLVRDIGGEASKVPV